MNTAVLLACFTLPSAVFGFELNYLGPDANFSKVPMDSEMPPVLIAKGFDPNKLNISILTSITFSGEMFAMQMIGIAPIQLALDRISSSGLLDAYNIKVEVVDDNCFSSEFMPIYMSALSDREESEEAFPLFMGPHCSAYVQLGPVLPHIGYSGATTYPFEPVVSRNRRLFPSFYHLLFTPNEYYRMIAHFLAAQKWRQIALLSESIYNVLEDDLLDEMAKLGLAVSARAYHDPNPNPGDIEKGLTELKTAGARIIFLNTDFVMDTWCFLAKLKMFGPSYAFLIPSFNEMPIDDPFRSNETADWCTIDMVIHLFESSHFFIFGDVSLSGSSGGNQVDSTGLLGRDFDEVSLNTLEQPDLSFGWDMERHRLYDQTMFAAYWLNATETILNEQNLTLADWVTGSELFQSEPQRLLSITKQAISKVKYEGLQASYAIDAKTETNVYGKVQFAVAQVNKLYGAIFVPNVAWIYRRSIDGTFYPESQKALQRPPSVMLFSIATVFGANILLILRSSILVVRIVAKKKQDDVIYDIRAVINCLYAVVIILVAAIISGLAFSTSSLGNGRVLISNACFTLGMVAVVIGIIYGPKLFLPGGYFRDDVRTIHHVPPNISRDPTTRPSLSTVFLVIRSKFRWFASRQ